MGRNQAVRVMLGICCAIAVAVPVSNGSEPFSLDDIEFMVGHWASRSGQLEMEEVWLAAKGGVMLGLHRDVAPGSKAFFEFLRIEDRDGELVYVASPRGIGSTDFVLVTADQHGVVFENLEHDFPQRIIYRRDGNRLIARIEGEVGGKLKSSDWVWELMR